MLHASGVNSVSLQPTFVRTQAFGRAASLAWVKAPQLFGLLEPYELSAIYVLLVTLAQREYITQVVVFALGALGASHG
jgi:hypothetical protein